MAPPLSPGAWLSLLEPLVLEQARLLRLYEDYYEGRHRLAFATQKFRETFGQMFTSLADNWCEVVVDAAVERLKVVGFTFGGEGADADDDAWTIWQDNALDAESVLAHTEAVKTGKAYLLVSPPEADGESPQITVEHPSQVFVFHAPGNRRKRLAAIKRWIGDDDYDYGVVYTPDWVQWWRSREPRRRGSTGTGRNMIPLVEGSGPNPFAPVVPIVPLYNNPTVLEGGRSDLKPAIPLQDAINKEVADALVASEFAAFPQRVLMGIEVPTDPTTGQPRKEVQMAAAVSRFWALENPDAKVAEFSAADLGNYGTLITVLLQHLAAQTRTPPHYLLGQIVNASGDALKAAETGLVARVKRKQTDFGDGWEEAIALALKLKGKNVEVARAKTVWADPEYRAEGELVDAAIKLRTLGVPLEALWLRIGATPSQVEEWKKLAGLPERGGPATGIILPGEQPPPPPASEPSPPGRTPAAAPAEAPAP